MHAATHNTLIVDDPDFTYLCPDGSRAVRRLRLWRTTSKGTLAVVTERPEDPGVSITNAAETVWAAVQRIYGDPGRLIPVVEHYPAERGLPETFDLVSLDVHGKPCWERVLPALLLLSIGLDAYPDC